VDAIIRGHNSIGEKHRGCLPYSKYSWMLSAFYVLMLAFIALVNILVDPYGVFRSNFFVPTNVNERFSKIYHLDDKNADYDTYILGSSTAGLIRPASLVRYLPGAKVYNLYVSNGDIVDYDILLKYMLKRRFPIKTILLQLDPDAFLRPSTNIDYSRRHLPQVSGEPWINFYTDYLFSFSPTYVWEKIDASLERRQSWLDVEKTGTWRNIPAEGIDPHEWSKREPTFSLKVASEYKGENLPSKIALLEDFLSLAKRENIKVLIMTQASNHIEMNYWDIPAYLKLLSEISKVTNFWDFGGYNSVTKNNDNYYDIHHARPEISQLMLADVFGESAASIPSDFGVFITAMNADTVIADRARNLLVSRRQESQ